MICSRTGNPQDLLSRRWISKYFVPQFLKKRKCTTRSKEAARRSKRKWRDVGGAEDLDCQPFCWMGEEKQSNKVRKKYSSFPSKKEKLREKI